MNTTKRTRLFVDDLTVVQLRKQLELHGVSTRGNRLELMERLKNVLAQAQMVIRQKLEAGDEQTMHDAAADGFTRQDPLSRLPQHLLFAVCDWLPLRDVGQLACVGRLWRKNVSFGLKDEPSMYMGYRRDVVLVLPDNFSARCLRALLARLTNTVRMSLAMPHGGFRLCSLLSLVQQYCGRRLSELHIRGVPDIQKYKQRGASPLSRESAQVLVFPQLQCLDVRARTVHFSETCWNALLSVIQTAPRLSRLTLSGISHDQYDLLASGSRSKWSIWSMPQLQQVFLSHGLRHLKSSLPHMDYSRRPLSLIPIASLTSLTSLSSLASVGAVDDEKDAVVGLRKLALPTDRHYVLYSLRQVRGLPNVRHLIVKCSHLWVFHDPEFAVVLPAVETMHLRFMSDGWATPLVGRFLHLSDLHVSFWYRLKGKGLLSLAQWLAVPDSDGVARFLPALKQLRFSFCKLPALWPEISETLKRAQETVRPGLQVQVHVTNPTECTLCV